MKLLDYIKGNRRGKGARDIELDSMTDPFLWDALEGFDSVDGDHAAAIERLSRSVMEKARLKKSRKPVYILTAAASLAVLITAGWLLTRTGPVETAPAEVILAEASVERNTPAPEPADSIRGETASIEEISEKEIPVPSAPGGVSGNMNIVRDEENTGFDRTEFLKDEWLSEMDAPAAPEKPERDADDAMQELDMVIPEARSMRLRDSKIRSEQSAAPSRASSRPSSSSRVQAPSVPTGVDGSRIRGQVVDAHGEALIGCPVTVRGTTNGVVTNMDGAFEIEAQPGDVLVVSYLGYHTQEVRVNESGSFRVILQEDSSALDEVIAVGYRAEKRTEEGPAMFSRREVTDLPQTEQKAFLEYFEEHYIPITDNRGRPIQGDVTVTFRVDDSGKVRNIRVEETFSTKASNELKNLLRDYQKWNPTGEDRVRLTVRFGR